MKVVAGIKERFQPSLNNLKIEEFFLIEKTDKPEDCFSTVVDYLNISPASAGLKIGLIDSEKSSSAMIGSFIAHLESGLSGNPSSSSSGKKLIETQDISEDITSFLSTRRKQDQELLEISSKSLTSFYKHCIKYFEDCIGSNKALSHLQISERIQGIFEEKKQKISKDNNLFEDFFEMAQEPFVQSGRFSLKILGESSSLNVEYRTVYIGVTLTYFDFTSFIGRTFMINTSEETEADYKVL